MGVLDERDGVYLDRRIGNVGDANIAHFTVIARGNEDGDVCAQAEVLREDASITQSHVAFETVERFQGRDEEWGKHAIAVGSMQT